MKPADLTQNRQLGTIAAIRAHAWYNADVRSIAILLLGFICVLLLVPPTRSFPITDDWVYAQSVTDLLNWAYKPHDFSQATALIPIVWGALFSLIFGQSFTTLAIANLAMSAACIIIFYLLLRQMQITAQHALFGTALLALNPMYVYLSYSFMTEITFMTFMLSSCLCYIRGMQKYAQQDDRWAWQWLLAGSVAAALAYLTRQLGILLLPAILIHLWWSQRWTWRRAIICAAVPLAVTITYTLWAQAQPTKFVDTVFNNWTQFVINHPTDFVTGRLQLGTWAAAALGLSLFPLVWFPRQRFLAACIAIILITFQVQRLQVYGTAFPQNGNIVDRTGFIMLSYNASPIWSEPIWLVLAIIGAVATSLYVVASGGQLWGQLRTRPWRHMEDPSRLLYLLAFMLAGVTFLLSMSVFDRYLLPILPLLMVPGLRHLDTSRAKTNGNANNREIMEHQTWRWVLLLPVALFAFIGQRDYMAHSDARWKAAERLVSSGVRHEQISAGFEWGGWYSYEAGAQYIRDRQGAVSVGFPPDAILDPAFAVSDLPHPRYTEIGSLPYESWLVGGQTKRVLLLKRK